MSANSSTRSFALAATAYTAWMLLVLVCGSRSFARPDIHTVYPIYTYAAGQWRAGEDLYIIMPGYDFFRYSPLAAAGFVPWQWLGDATGGMVWRAAGALLLAFGIAAWARALWPRLSVAWIYLLTWPFVLQNVNNGQINVHMLALLLFGTAATSRGQYWRGALFLTLAGLIKPYVLSVAGLLAIVEPRLIGRLILFLTGGLLAPFALHNPDYVSGQYYSWIRHLRNNDRSQAPLRVTYRDLQLIFRVWAWPLPPWLNAAIEAIAGIALSALIGMSRYLRRPRRDILNFAFALGCCWSTVLGPATESCTYILLAPALAAATLSSRGLARCVLTFAFAIFFGTEVALAFPDGWRLQTYGTQPIAALMFLGVTVAQAIRSLLPLSFNLNTAMINKRVAKLTILLRWPTLR